LFTARHHHLPPEPLIRTQKNSRIPAYRFWLTNKYHYRIQPGKKRKPGDNETVAPIVAFAADNAYRSAFDFPKNRRAGVIH